MKTFFKISLASLLMLTQVSWAADTVPGQTRASEYQRQVGDVVFSLNNMKQIIEQLDFSDDASRAAISKETAELIFERLSAAIELAGLVLADPSMTDEQKSPLLKDLYSHIGDVFFDVLRQQDSTHKEDRLNAAVEANDPNLFYLVGRELFSDIHAMMPTRTQGVQGQASDQYIWGVTARAERERLTLRVFNELQNFSRDAVGAVPENSEMRRKTVAFWQKQIEKMRLIRTERVTAQKAAIGMYVTLATVGLVFPAVDVVGLFDGRSEYSLFVSSLGYFSFWATASILKIKASGLQSIVGDSKSLKALRSWGSLLENPRMAVDPIQQQHIVKNGAGFLSQFRTLVSSVIAQCRLTFKI